MKRRALLRCACAGPALALLAACGDDTAWPEGMAPIKWDRDNCTRCGMAISDRRFAVQVRGGPRNTALKFDDIGCATTWCAEKSRDNSWLNDATTRFWVADFDRPGQGWLNARQAHYGRGPRSPMGYDYSAHAQTGPDRVAFEAMAEKTAATWPANCGPDATRRTG